MHHIYFQAWRDSDKEWLPWQCILDEQAIEKIINKWSLELKVPIMEEEIQEEEDDREVGKEALKKFGEEEKT